MLTELLHDKQEQQMDPVLPFHLQSKSFRGF